MLGTRIVPSELHLKKELNAIQKARFFRDPETVSSSRLSASHRSVASTTSLINGNQRIGKPKGRNSPSSSFGTSSGSGNRRKKIYLYNWGRQRSKSSESGKELEDGIRQESVLRSPGDGLSNNGNVNSKRYVNHGELVVIHGARGTKSNTPIRTVRKLRRSISEEPTNKSGIFKRRNRRPRYPGVGKSIEQPEDPAHCNTEELWQRRHQAAQKDGYAIPFSSPSSGSGSGNRPRYANIFKYAKGDDASHSCAPKSLYNRYGGKNPSPFGFQVGTSVSVNEDEVDQLDLGCQGWGIPCYGSKRTKDSEHDLFYSQSLSDTPRSKVSHLLCGHRKSYNKRRLSRFHKQKYCSYQGLPLLTDSFSRGSLSEDASGDELSITFELDLESVNKLNGRTWSSCRSQEALDLALPRRADREMPESKALSQKHRPRAFCDIVGQNVIVRSLTSAISRGRIAPAYLFQGPRGTGKKSTARIFATALNCLSTEYDKPCGLCKVCTKFANGTGSNIREVDATNKNITSRLKYLLRKLTAAKAFSRYKIFIIDECHMLSSKTWSIVEKFLEEFPSQLVFLLITSDPQNLPPYLVSHCQKYLFTKIKDAEIVQRLGKLSREENLDVELDALDLIATHSDGSLQNAEMMLEQLSLLGKRITASLVNDHVGVVPSEKLLDLLEIAMSSDMAETVRRSRELMDSSVNPLVLMCQLAGLIKEIIAGTFQDRRKVIGRQSLTEVELEKFQQALQILSNAKKQLRRSIDRSAWFTAALLQLGSGQMPEASHSSTSSKRSTKTMIEGTFKMAKEASSCPDECNPSLNLQESNTALVFRIAGGHSTPNGLLTREKSSDSSPPNLKSIDRGLEDFSHKNVAIGEWNFRHASSENLDGIWRRCVEKCHSEKLRKMLHAHGKLVSVMESEGDLIAFVAFNDLTAKSQAERFLSSLTESFEVVLKRNVELRIGLAPESYLKSLSSLPELPIRRHSAIIRLLDEEIKLESDGLNGSSNIDRRSQASDLPRRSVDHFEGGLQSIRSKFDSSPSVDSSRMVNSRISSSKESKGTYRPKANGSALPHMSPMGEHSLGSTWPHDARKDMHGVQTHLESTKNKVFPSHGLSWKYQRGSPGPKSISSKLWEDEQLHEIQELNIVETKGDHKKQVDRRRIDQHVLSPSSLHTTNFAAKSAKESPGYESGPGCNGLLCWKTGKSRKVKVKQLNNVGSRKNRCLACL